MAGRPRTFQESDALERAMHLFWAQGYEATGLTQLLDHIGMARQSMYNVFGEKRSLYLKALRLYSEKSLGKLTAKLGSGTGTSYDRLCDVLFTFADDPAEGEPTGCLIVNAACEFGTKDQEIAAVIRLHWSEVEAKLLAGVEAAMREGDLPPGLDPNRAALFLSQVLNGLAVMQKAGRSRLDRRETATAALEGLPVNV